MDKLGKNKYKYVKNLLSLDIVDFLSTWSIQNFKITPDPQAPMSFSVHSDDSQIYSHVLQYLKPVMEKEAKLKLSETYSYARIYKKGDVLKRHKDRFSCEISTTMHLGGEQWPIYLEPSGEEGQDGVEVNLKQGDMLMYRGCDLEHWREPFDGENCGQVFLHYNNIKSAQADKNKFDGRPLLGLPSWFKNQGE